MAEAAPAPVRPPASSAVLSLASSAAGAPAASEPALTESAAPFVADVQDVDSSSSDVARDTRALDLLEGMD